jgi:hypothetical protein
MAAACWPPLETLATSVPFSCSAARRHDNRTSDSDPPGDRVWRHGQGSRGRTATFAVISAGRAKQGAQQRRATRTPTWLVR